MDRDYTYRILGCLYEVHRVLGPGLLEDIYEAAAEKELKDNGFDVKRQVYVPVIYKGMKIQHDLRLDLLVDDKIILEIKSVANYSKLFEKQLYTYMRLMKFELGYVVNFNVEYLRDGIHPVINK